MGEILLSVVIPTFNSEHYLENCLRSVDQVDRKALEFILVDGESKDSTMRLVDKYHYLFSHVISEPDRGQSDAFNKGYRLASGRFITWLNSDDVLIQSGVRRVLEELETTSYDWLTANCVYLDKDGYVLRCCRSGQYEQFAVDRGLLNVFGPSTFVSKSLYEKLGPIDEEYHYCMDTEYWWRIVASGRSYKRINCYFWGLRLHSEAKTANVLLTGEYPPAMREEVCRIRLNYYPEQDSRGRRFAALLARFWRVLNFAYPRAVIDTLYWKGRSPEGL